MQFDLDKSIIDINTESEEESSKEADEETEIFEQQTGFVRVADSEDILGHKCTIAYVNMLKALAETAPRGVCKAADCGKTYDIVTKHTGTAVRLSWVSDNIPLSHPFCGLREKTAPCDCFAPQCK